MQRLAVEGSRHGIPVLFGFDVIHGLRTVLPVPIAMAASWDPATIERGQAVAAREARSVGLHWTFAPMVDIARDPRWGRIVEGAGEDPYLGSAVAAAQVRGFQGDHLGAPERVIAGPKHFAGYGAAVGGRDYDEVNLSDAELWNVYFPPFQAALAAGAGNVMTAYMDLNGIPASGNRWLFTEVLREQWGFEGFVVSDANAVRNLVTHGFAADLADAAARGVSVGVDFEMAMTDPAYSHLPEAVERGAVSIEAVDTCVRRVLEAKLRLVCSRTRTSTWSGPGPCWPIPRIARWRGWPRSVPRCCCATRTTCCPWTRRASPRSPSSARWPTPSATPWARGCSTSIWRRPSPSWRDCRAAGWIDRGPLRARDPPGPADVSVDVRHVPRQHAPRPPGLRRRSGVSAGRRPGPRLRPGHRGGRRVAADDR